MGNNITPYIPTIGLEIHAELKTTTKMFCGCINAPDSAAPNTHICPICMGHPGTLPHPNKEAVRKVLSVGLALGGTLASYSEFNRKNYFYPDIPKGYQLSQYEFPFVKMGTLAGVAITRVHLEEDTARSLHDQGKESLVDYNRAGVPLMELVTEPVIHDAETAGRFARELQLLLRTLGVSDANMEKGEMRVEANISVSREELGTKVEVKNLNSFKAVEGAIAFEVTRQIGLLEKGEEVTQETRGWDETTRKTFSQRKKESSHDYRYFKDPDIPSMDIEKIEEFSNSRLSENMPELPSKTRSIYTNLGLTSIQIESLLSSNELRSFFSDVIRREEDRDILKLAGNYLTSDVAGLLATGGRDLKATSESVMAFLELLRLVAEKKITSRVAKDLLAEVVFEAKSPTTLVEERGLGTDSSSEGLSALVESLLKEHPGVVAEVKAGKEAGLKFLVGQGMKVSKGTAEPTLLFEMLKKRIDEI